MGGMEISDDDNDTEKIIPGIDLGTTNSCVAVYRSENIEVLTNDFDNYTTPSQVSFSEKERFVGNAAKNRCTQDPQNTISSVKRLIGRRYSDESFQSDIKRYPYKIVKGPRDIPEIEVSYMGETKRFTPEEISAAILEKMKEILEDRFECKVSKAVITVPARFNNSQRQATKDAGAIAGFDRFTFVRLLSEPTAAAMAYHFHKKSGEEGEKTILVFDLGGGTFDVSVLEIRGGVYDVIATNGDVSLGGDDFDNRIADYFADQFERKKGVSIRGNHKSMRRLVTASERAKQLLSTKAEAKVEIDSLHSGIDFSATLTRAKFDDLCADYFKKCIEMVDDCLKDAKIDKSQVDDVVMAGGSTRIVKIQSMVREYFGKDLCKNINPDEVVAMGAAIKGADLSMDPSNRQKKVVLNDAVPMSLGTGVKGGLMSTIIPRNTNYPTWREESYITTSDNQTAMLIDVYEGERPRKDDNNWLGEFTLTGLPPRPCGMVKVIVKIEIDADGIVVVYAEHEESGNRGSIQIKKNSGRLTQSEISIKLEEAQRYKQQDDELRARVEAKNALESYAYSMRNKAQENPDNMSETNRERILKATKKAIAWVEANPNATKKESEQKHRQLKNLCSENSDEI